MRGCESCLNRNIFSDNLGAPRSVAMNYVQSICTTLKHNQFANIGKFALIYNENIEHITYLSNFLRGDFGDSIKLY